MVTEPDIAYKITTSVKKVEEKFRNFNHRLDAAGNHTFDSISIGWFVHFEGSNESILFGEKPPWEAGDEIEITFRRKL